MPHPKITSDKFLLEILRKRFSDYSDNKISGLQFSGEFIIFSLYKDLKQKIISGRFKKELPDFDQWEDLLAGKTEMAVFFSQYQFKFISSWANQTLEAWGKNNLPIIVIDEIPSPLKMLKVQRQGKRFVSALWQEKYWQQENILGKADPLEFLLHDIYHAYKFFLNPESYHGQIAFYDYMAQAIESNILDSFLKNVPDPTLKDRLHYILADMNGYPVHLVQTLKSVVWDFSKATGKSGEAGKEILLEWCNFWKFDQEITSAFISVGDKNLEQPGQAVLLHNFFVQTGANLLGPASTSI